MINIPLSMIFKIYIRKYRKKICSRTNGNNFSNKYASILSKGRRIYINRAQKLRDIAFVWARRLI